MKPFKNIACVLRRIQKSYSNPKALNYKEKGVWHHHSTEEYTTDIKHLALALHQHGVKKGDNVGIFAMPSPYWSIADFAIMAAGGVTVPIFANISDDNFAFEVTQTNLKIIFITSREQWDVINKHKDLFDIIITYDSDLLDDPKIRHYQDVLRSGKQLSERQPKLYDQLLDSIHEDDLATIIYTSGSTGVPKGVMLTHRSVVSVIHIGIFDWRTDTDRYLSILPLAHVFGRSLNFILIGWGVSIYYSNDIKNLGEIAREVHPSIIVVVPRLLEKIYAKMLSNVQHAGFMKRQLGLWAFDLANDEEDSLYKHLMHPIADKIVYSVLRDALGGNLRIVITGGAALNPHLGHFFLDIGVPVYEGWGLTEAATVTVNKPDKYKLGAVGYPLEGMELKISPEGEVLVRGAIVMKGYYRNPEATAIALDKEGWLHTGDKGTIDENGFLTIIGRLKELYKTSTGEYVAPVPIEQALGRVPLIDMAMVVAEGKKFTSCLLFPNFEILERMKSEYKLSKLSNEEFLKSDIVKKEMENVVQSINAHFNPWEQIHEYRFIPKTLSIEAGEITPSMKIKRDVVAKKYQDVIDSIYAEEAK